VPHVLKDNNTFILGIKQSKKSIHIFRVEQSTLLGLPDPEDKGIMILQNIRYSSASDPAPHPERFTIFPGPEVTLFSPKNVN
jgi:hypothetical protein